MRELERAAAELSPALPRRLAVIGRGRLGSAIAPALSAAGLDVVGPLGRGTPPTADAVLLCVPDAEIPAAAEACAGVAPLVGHTSGATPLSALDPSGAEAFGLHPLQTFTMDGGSFAGAGCATGGTTPRALATAGSIGRALGMRPFALADADRPAYHAAASIASNFLVTLEAAAERVGAAAGLPRDLLVPLVEQTVANWAALGAEKALTGPVARGDEATIQRQREAVEAAAPELVPLWQELVTATRALAPAHRPLPTSAHRPLPTAH